MCGGGFQHAPAKGALVARRRGEEQREAEADDVLNVPLRVEILVDVPNLHGRYPMEGGRNAAALRGGQLGGGWRERAARLQQPPRAFLSLQNAEDVACACVLKPPHTRELCDVTEGHKGWTQGGPVRGCAGL